MPLWPLSLDPMASTMSRLGSTSRNRSLTVGEKTAALLLRTKNDEMS
jgi:hypothetical protein